MAEALQLARRGRFSTSPNPAVGCLIVRDGQVVGRGWHRRAGEAHAEIHALREAGAAARGATVYVTLEPCSHTGRTPPCADALVGAGVARVVAAMPDPDPRVSGRGFERLRGAGIEVACGLLEAQARALNPGFVARMERGWPWLRLKLAASLDGRTALASGESRWISGPEARRDVQYWRAQSCAVMTGSGTVLADDPSLNVRLQADELEGVVPVRQPLRVVLDSHLRTPPDARLLTLEGSVLVLAAEGADTAQQMALEAAGAEVCVLPAGEDGRPRPRAVLEELARRECNMVMLECGPTLAGRFMAEGLVDELILYLAPHLMGDAARGMFHLPALAQMKDRLALEWWDVRQVGDSLRLSLRPIRGRR
ncbi:MAG TPA: bifunctional diaminohydroxyphosphoribosylaminopyrimidine deaminase/5-amino-6-(5-phosphoribosylamino)uracil reductase RibD [Gammaproteobacteria bacterium]|nr:bifunctional diaminohydroxyphosphoribosylaminopyrimidine deaminase/5-amino-6-(5-phosphoribosylamino)uracil reductase RibD [Gammaproteobacteria bacterium]